MAPTVVICADLQRLVPSHDKTSLVVLLVPQQSHVSSTTLLPLAGVSIKLEELRPHLERHLLQFFVRLGVDLLRQVDDGLEVNVRRVNLLFGLQERVVTSAHT